MQSLSEALSDPELKERGTVLEVEHPVFGTVREVNTPVRLPTSEKTHRRAPTLGEDTERILKDYLHCSDNEIETLKLEGAI